MTEIRYGVTRTGGWGAGIIRWGTHSPVNHAFVCNTQGETIEAQPGGMAYGHASRYPDAIYSQPITGVEAERVWAWSVAHIGTGYGWLDIAAIALSVLHVPTPRWAIRRLANPRTLICSQAVTLAYAAAGITLGDKAAWLTTPGDLLDVIQHTPEPAAHP